MSRLTYCEHVVGMAQSQAADWLIEMRCDKQSHVLPVMSLVVGESLVDTLTE